MIPVTTLLDEIGRCTICAPYLPHGPRPVLQLHPEARILVTSQAPGRKVHASGVPFSDASGERLREWLGVSADVFYDPRQFAIVPMGFCFPGSGRGGDMPPRPECAHAWRPKIAPYLGNVELTLVVGQYAQAWYFPGTATSVTATVKSWRDHWPAVVPLPHPSPRNNVWLRRNPWFSEELVPQLEARVAEVLQSKRKTPQCTSRC